MKEYVREYPLFSLCGLNCGLCPRFHTEGSSRCPGCGGKDFRLKHPACSVITCTQKHDNAEYCFQCSQYPCDRYRTIGGADSFISYRHILFDMEKAKQDLNRYQSELNEKVEILELLIGRYNDGKRKNFYCLAVNLLELDDLKEIMSKVKETVGTPDTVSKADIERISALFEAKAREESIELKLRK